MAIFILCIVLILKNDLHLLKICMHAVYIASITVGVKAEEYEFIQQLADEDLYPNILQLTLLMVIQMSYSYD